MTAINIGTAVPDFEAPSTGNKTIKLTDYRGRFVVIYFYPKTIRPVAPKKAKPFVTLLKNLRH